MCGCGQFGFWRQMESSGCCQGFGFGFRRMFYSKEERKRELEEYKERLQKELAGVEEALKELSGSQQ
ncbi:MAG: hypothetical protein ACP5R4_05505 [Armatimonadota bacterium]